MNKSFSGMSNELSLMRIKVWITEKAFFLATWRPGKTRWFYGLSWFLCSKKAKDQGKSLIHYSVIGWSLTSNQLSFFPFSFNLWSECNPKRVNCFYCVQWDETSKRLLDQLQCLLDILQSEANLCLIFKSSFNYFQS
jgi:hypothetical protein